MRKPDTPHPRDSTTTGSGDSPKAKTPAPALSVWGGDEGHVARAGGRAASEDRAHRAAWPGQVLRSAYLNRVALPDRVPPGDVAQARDILRRLEMVLGEHGKWTRTERVRLRRMRDAWEARAGGRDVEFMAVGWVRHRKYLGRGEYEETQEARKFAQMVKDLREGW